LLVEGHKWPIVCFVVSSVSTWDAEEPGDCGTGVFIAEEGNRVGGKGSAEVSELLEYHRLV
jgi:hypothetical protein